MLSIFQVVELKPENKSLSEGYNPETKAWSQGRIQPRNSSAPGLLRVRSFLSEKGATTKPALAKGHSRSRTPWFCTSWFKRLSLWEEESDWSSLSGLSSSCTNQLCPGFSEGMGNILSPGAVTV